MGLFEDIYNEPKKINMKESRKEIQILVKPIITFTSHPEPASPSVPDRPKKNKHKWKNHYLKPKAYVKIAAAFFYVAIFSTIFTSVILLASYSFWTKFGTLWQNTNSSSVKKIKYIHATFTNVEQPFIYYAAGKTGHKITAYFEGKTTANGDSCAVNILQDNERSLHVRLYHKRNQIAMSAFISQRWVPSITVNQVMNSGDPFSVLITSDDDGFKVKVNNKSTYTFPHAIKPRIAYHGVQIWRMTKDYSSFTLVNITMQK